VLTDVVTLYSYCTHTVLTDVVTLYSYCTHTVLTDVVTGLQEDVLHVAGADVAALDIPRLDHAEYRPMYSEYSGSIVHGVYI
jgi:hypothetical protein